MSFMSTTACYAQRDIGITVDRRSALGEVCALNAAVRIVAGSSHVEAHEALFRAGVTLQRHARRIMLSRCRQQAPTLLVLSPRRTTTEDRSQRRLEAVMKCVVQKKWRQEAAARRLSAPRQRQEVNARGGELEKGCSHRRTRRGTYAVCPCCCRCCIAVCGCATPSFLQEVGWGMGEGNGTRIKEW